MSKVVCHDLQEFATVCAEFVRAGVLFNADAGTLVITLTGGF